MKTENSAHLASLRVCGFIWEYTRKNWPSRAEVSPDVDRSTWICREQSRPGIKIVGFSSQASKVKWKSQNNYQVALGFRALSECSEPVDPSVSSRANMSYISLKILQTRTFLNKLLRRQEEEEGGSSFLANVQSGKNLGTAQRSQLHTEAPQSQWYLRCLGLDLQHRWISRGSRITWIQNSQISSFR